MHVVSHHKEHFRLRNERCMILSARDLYDILRELKVDWKPNNFTEQAVTKTQLAAVV